METREYEFTPADNQVLSDVSHRMKIFAWLMLGSAVFSLASTAYQLVSMGIGMTPLFFGMGGTVISVAFYFVIAFLTLSASGSLEAAARTGGNDVTHMMKALMSLKTLFGIQYWLIVTLIVLVILVMIGVFIAVFAIG